MGVLGHYILKAIQGDSVVETSVRTVSQVGENCACVWLRLALVSQESALEMNTTRLS